MISLLWDSLLSVFLSLSCIHASRLCLLLFRRVKGQRSLLPDSLVSSFRSLCCMNALRLKCDFCTGAASNRFFILNASIAAFVPVFSVACVCHETKLADRCGVEEEPHWARICCCPLCISLCHDCASRDIAFRQVREGSRTPVWRRLLDGISVGLLTSTCACTSTHTHA